MKTIHVVQLVGKPRRLEVGFSLTLNWKLCRVEELQQQLAHQCSPNIIGIWEWGICGLMGGAFIT